MIQCRVVLLFLLSTYVETANILYVIPFTATSHYISLRPIGLELARRGHNVTVITSNRETHPPPNYRQIMVDHKMIWDVIGEERPNLFSLVDMSTRHLYHKIVWNGGLALTEITLNSTEVKEFLKEENTFDLVINEQFFQEALYSLAFKYNAPSVVISTYGNCMRHNIVQRNPLQLATVRQEFLEAEDLTSFWGRLKNSYFSLYEYLWWRFVYLKDQERLVKKYLPDIADTVPSLYELQQNISLLLSNSHFSFDTAAALLPNIVEIGGVHLYESDDTRMPQDLQKILDESHNGVVYMNFGSNVRSSELPDDKKNALLNVFRKIKQTVIWKWEDDKLDDKPQNLVLRRWLPQKQILEHPNIEVFISHGGLIGTQEAIFNGVPIIGVPIFADQYNNLFLVQEAGIGKVLRYHDINEQTFDEVLHEVLSNKTYYKQAKAMSRVFKDRPMNPLENAVFWIEYVIRNKGAEYMKNPARNISWIAYNMIDVYIFTISLFALVLLVAFKFVSFIRNSLDTQEDKITKNKKHN